MVIRVGDLDKGVKDSLCSTIMTGLFKEYSTLPSDVEKIDTVISSLKSNGSLDQSVKDYYREIAERDVSVDISSEDYRRVWLHTT